jgi:hypothetical protein
MHIDGWAFKTNELYLRDKNTARYKEIEHLKNDIDFKVTPAYGCNHFQGTLKTENAKSLSEKDIALIMDHGSLCFGGTCDKSGDTFKGSYNTD